jgi:hypothetical protein
MLDDELSVSTRERDGVAIIDLVGDVTTFAEEKINNADSRNTSRRSSAWSAWRSMPISTRMKTRQFAGLPQRPPDAVESFEF